MTYLNNIKSILPSWLEKEISVNNYKNYQTLDFPFLDCNNDYLRLYIVYKEDGNLYFTDDGDSYSSLAERIIGAKNSISSFFDDKVIQIVNSLPMVKFNTTTKELYNDCKPTDDLGFIISMMIEAMISFSVACNFSVFPQETKKVTMKFKKTFEYDFLKKNNCNFDTNPKVMGEELGEHTFDYLVYSKQNNYIKLLNDRDSTTKKALLYDWKDVRNYKNLPPLIAISKGDDPQKIQNKKENERLSQIIRNNNILLFSAKSDRTKIDRILSA